METKGENDLDHDSPRVKSEILAILEVTDTDNDKPVVTACYWQNDQRSASITNYYRGAVCESSSKRFYKILAENMKVLNIR